MLGLRFAPRSRWDRPPRYQIAHGDIESGEVATLLLPMPRERLLTYLPSRGKVAEIGVAQGNLAWRLRKTCRPTFLALIDAWRELSDDVYGAPAELQEQRYRRVLRRFASERPDQVCRVYRKYSLEAADEFKDGFFDWVYVDADHNYEACLADLRRWSPKISSGGLICGHDFAVRPGRPNYGVVEAVTTFLRETGYYMAAVTIEPSPSFVIAKSPDSACFMRFRELLFTFEPHLVRVGWDAARIHQMTKLKNCAGAAALMTLSVRSAQDDPHLASRL